MTKYVIYCKKKSSKLLNIESFESDKFHVTCTENVKCATIFDYMSIATLIKDSIQNQYKVDYLSCKQIDADI